jgi:hypothetical protein
MISAPLHDFQERLLWSEDASGEPFWDAVYRKAFPNLVNHMQCNGNTTSQRMGVDRVLHLSNGRTLYIDEKKREREYDDILLEYVSVDSTGAPGWMEKDLSIDYLAYAFMPSKRCYLFPWLMLRRAWMRFGEDWKQQHRIVQARNNGYSTWSVAVPIAVVQQAVRRAMIIDVADSF